MRAGMCDVHLYNHFENMNQKNTGREKARSKTGGKASGGFIGNVGWVDLGKKIYYCPTRIFKIFENVFQLQIRMNSWNLKKLHEVILWKKRIGLQTFSFLLTFYFYYYYYSYYYSCSHYFNCFTLSLLLLLIGIVIENIYSHNCH